MTDIFYIKSLTSEKHCPSTSTHLSTKCHYRSWSQIVILLITVSYGCIRKLTWLLFALNFILIGGTKVAPWLERGPHVQRLCCGCSYPGFDSTLQPFAAYHSLFFLHFLSRPSAALSIIIFKKNLNIILIILSFFTTKPILSSISSSLLFCLEAAMDFLNFRWDLRQVVPL